MANWVEAAGDLLSVRIYGEITKRDILEAVSKLRVLDPHKERCDLWTFAPESVLPYMSFAEVLRTIRGYCSPETVGNKTAVVADGSLQRAVMEMYRAEASVLPFEIRVFDSRDEAMAWLTA